MKALHLDFSIIISSAMVEKSQHVHHKQANMVAEPGYSSGVAGSGSQVVRKKEVSGGVVPKERGEERKEGWDQNKWKLAQ